jgi:polyisoprenoid-binding protein YceI
MTRGVGVSGVVAVALCAWCISAWAEPRTFNVNHTSRVTFRTEAPLETIVGTTAGRAAVSGTVVVDAARPQDVRGIVRVDLNALRTGFGLRDAVMRSRIFLDSETNETNRYAVFEVKGVEIAGPIEPGKITPVRVRGTLTMRGKSIETLAESTINYLRLSPEQVEGQKRLGLAAENIRVTTKFATTFTNHGMKVPAPLIPVVSNDIQLETNLMLVLSR